MSETNRNGKPIPIKFSDDATKLIGELKARTGYSQAEVIRRAVRLLEIEVERRAGDVTFIMTELAPSAAKPRTMPRQQQQTAARLNEPGKKYAK